MANIYVLLKSKSDDIGHQDYSPRSTFCDGKPIVPSKGNMKSPCATSDEINGASSSPTAPLVQSAGSFKLFFFTARQQSCANVMFTFVSVCPRRGIPVQDTSPTPYRVLALDLPPPVSVLVPSPTTTHSNLFTLQHRLLENGRLVFFLNAFFFSLPSIVINTWFSFINN